MIAKLFRWLALSVILLTVVHWCNQADWHLGLILGGVILLVASCILKD